MSNDVLEQLKAAIAARRNSLEELRSRLEALITPIPVGVVLSDVEGEIGKIERVCTGASQWGNRTWDVTINGKGLIHRGKLVTETCDRSYFDGNNMHHHSIEPFMLGDHGEGDALSWLSGRETRVVAARLPLAIVRYIEECRAETEANTSTAV